MKYGMVLVKEDAGWESLSEAERDFDTIVQWWIDLRRKGLIQTGAELGPPRTATTIAFDGDEAVITDGPFLEAKETVGGFGILNVETREEAIEIARTWPSRRNLKIEIRPIVS
jgi:hypothetical protein